MHLVELAQEDAIAEEKHTAIQLEDRLAELLTIISVREKFPQAGVHVPNELSRVITCQLEDDMKADMRDAVE